ncbi:BRO family protein [Bengtsoniella intestinalis]|uniref:phage antirepressor n=1 Tax=Bengtsoniella intestinalis TaxID=3073143 RepID=UPI00391F01E3
MDMELKVLTHEFFGEIRTTMGDKGNVLFCGVDVAMALGYANPRKALRDHCKGGTKRSSLTNGGVQELIFLYEPDLYRLIVKSKLPAAVEFERWVFEDVLPSLRKYGAYVQDDVLRDPQRLSEALEQLQQEKQELSTQLIEAKPKLDYLQTILESDCTMTSTQVAADYGISAIQLNRILHKLKVHRKVGGQWILYKKYMDMCLTKSETIIVQKTKAVVRTKWTQKGRIFIHYELSVLGIHALVDTPYPEMQEEIEYDYT